MDRWILALLFTRFASAALVVVGMAFGLSDFTAWAESIAPFPFAASMMRGFYYMVMLYAAYIVAVPRHIIIMAREG